MLAFILQKVNKIITHFLTNHHLKELQCACACACVRMCLKCLCKCFIACMIIVSHVFLTCAHVQVPVVAQRCRADWKPLPPPISDRVWTPEGAYCVCALCVCVCCLFCVHVCMYVCMYDYHIVYVCVHVCEWKNDTPSLFFLFFFHVHYNSISYSFFVFLFFFFF